MVQDGAQLGLLALLGSKAVAGGRWLANSSGRLLRALTHWLS